MPTDDLQAWAEKLEKYRRSLDLRLDGEGRWFHEGQPFEHPRLIEAFDAGIDIHPETGEPILRLGDKWCYIRADDTPFVVRRLVEGDGGLVAHLNNGERLPVPADAFEATDAHVYLRLAPRRRARLGRTVQNGLADRLEETPDGLAYRAGGRRWLIRRI